MKLPSEQWPGSFRVTAFLLAVLGLVVALSFAVLGSEGLILPVSGLIVLLVSLGLMQRGADILNPRRISITGFFYLSFIPMIYVPSFLTYYQNPGPYRLEFILGVMSAMITVPLGVLAANGISRYSRAENRSYFESPIQETSSGSSMFVVCVGFFGIAALITALYFSQIDLGSLPIVHMIKNPGDTAELTILREEAFKLLDPRWAGESSTVLFYGYLFLRTLIYPFLIVVTFGYFVNGGQRRWLFLFLGTLATGGFYAASSIARAPLAAIVMRLGFFLYLFRGGNLGKRTMTLTVVLMLAFPLLVTGFAYGSAGFGEALLRVWLRFFYTPAGDLYEYFEVFPEFAPFQYGGTLVKPIRHLLGLPYFYVENFVYLHQFPGTVTSTGHANAAFLSNLHADFGAAGVIIGGFLTGIMVQGVQIYLARQAKTVISVSLYAFAIYAFWVLNFGSITSVLGTNGVVFVFILAWGLRQTDHVVARVFGRKGRGRLPLVAEPQSS